MKRPIVTQCLCTLHKVSRASGICCHIINQAFVSKLGSLLFFWFCLLRFVKLPREWETEHDHRGRSRLSCSLATLVPRLWAAFIVPCGVCVIAWDVLVTTVPFRCALSGVEAHGRFFSQAHSFWRRLCLVIKSIIKSALHVVLGLLRKTKFTVFQIEFSSNTQNLTKCK